MADFNWLHMSLCFMSNWVWVLDGCDHYLLTGKLSLVMALIFGMSSFVRVLLFGVCHVCFKASSCPFLWLKWYGYLLSLCVVYDSWGHYCTSYFWTIALSIASEAFKHFDSPSYSSAKMFELLWFAIELWCWHFVTFWHQIDQSLYAINLWGYGYT